VTRKKKGTDNLRTLPVFTFERESIQDKRILIFLHVTRFLRKNQHHPLRLGHRGTEKALLLMTVSGAQLRFRCICPGKDTCNHPKYRITIYRIIKTKGPNCQFSSVLQCVAASVSRLSRCNLLPYTLLARPLVQEARRSAHLAIGRAHPLFA
jgi:hypothetical protein